MKNFIKLVLISVLGGTITLGAYLLFFDKEESVNTAQGHSMPVFTTAATFSEAAMAAEETDFTVIAENTINAVVHVKNVSVSSASGNPLLEFFFVVLMALLNDSAASVKLFSFDWHKPR